VGRLACVALLAVGCTTANPAYDVEDGGAGESTRGDEAPASSGLPDAGTDGDSSASGGSIATTEATTSSSGGGQSDCPEECGADATCVATGSGSECTCDPGFEGDGSVCVPVATLEPLAWQLDCMGNSASCSSDDVCAVEAPMDEHEVTRTDVAVLMGDPEAFYQVKLHVRGVMEPKAYLGGETNSHWNEGGTPVDDGWNAAYLELEDPPRLIYVNAGPPAARFCMALDHEIVVRMRGGSTLEIGVSDGNNCTIINVDEQGGAPISLPDVEAPAQPHDGQFMRVEAVSIVAE
jgi:hypothetical protein